MLMNFKRNCVKIMFDQPKIHGCFKSGSSCLVQFSEGSEKSSISWTLDVSDTDLTVKSVELDVESSVFETGRIVWQLCGGTICLMPLPGS